MPEGTAAPDLHPLLNGWVGPVTGRPGYDPSSPRRITADIARNAAPTSVKR